MFIKTKLVLLVSALAIGPTAFAIVLTSGYTTSVNYTGLYNDSGTLLTSGVSITGCDYSLSYIGTNATAPLTGAVYLHPYEEPGTGNPYWPTRLRLRFNSNTWAQYPTATVGIQVLNYLMNRTISPSSVVVGAPIDWFVEPTTSNLLTPPPTPRSRWTANVNYNDVNPRTFTLSQFSVDPSDTTGRTAVVTFDSGASYNQPAATYPWDTIWPFNGFLSDTNAASNGNTYQQFIGVVWCFPRVGYSGFSSGNVPVLYPYPISPD